MARDKQLEQRPAQGDEAVEQKPVPVSVPPEGPRPPDESGDGSDAGAPHDAVGAYLLDALPDDERLTFEAHLAECLSCQAEVRELAPVVQLLPRILEIEPPPEIIGHEQETVDLVSVQPGADLRNRIVTTVREEQPNNAKAPVQTGDSPAAVEEDADPDVTADALRPLPMPRRPPGRVRRGVARERGAGAEAGVWQTVSHLAPAWLAAATLAIVAVGAIIWALALQGQVDDLKGEIAAQNDEIAQLRGASNATAALLGPTEDGPSNASGTLYYSLQADQPPVLALHGMSQLSSDRVYQLWYIKGQAAPVPGPTFQADNSGTAMVPVANDVPTYTAVAITAEPDGGSKAPTMPILMMGQLSGARG